MNCLRSDIDHAGARLREKQKQKKKALFISLDLRAVRRKIERHRGNNDNGLFLLIKGLDQLPERNKLALEFLEPFGGFFDRDRKSTRLYSSHLGISYAVFCLKKEIY